MLCRWKIKAPRLRSGWHDVTEKASQAFELLSGAPGVKHAWQAFESIYQSTLVTEQVNHPQTMKFGKLLSLTNCFFYCGNNELENRTKIVCDKSEQRWNLRMMIYTMAGISPAVLWFLHRADSCVLFAFFTLDATTMEIAGINQRPWCKI